MTGKLTCLTLCGLLFTLYSVVEAQQPAKIPKIGYLIAGSAPSTVASEFFRREFRGLRYVEGKNIVFEYRFANNNLDRLPALAEELVRLQVDVLVTGATSGAIALKNASKTIPIVFFIAGDPVEAGVVDSLARPGGNIQGSLMSRQYWLVNNWSCSKKPFLSLNVWRYCGTQEFEDPSNHGTKVN